VERKNKMLIYMARTMLEEYTTSERFWSEVVNTACHAINHLYLHRLLKKMTYELLTSNKPNVFDFRAFGSKYYVLVKRGRHSKFVPKVVEGFLLGYGSNTKTYRVFNKSSRLVEVTCDVVFDEINGSPREQVDIDDVDENVVPTVTMRTMVIGDVRPHRNNKTMINILPQQWCNPHLKVRNRYLKTMAWIKGEHMNKKTRRKKKYHMPLQLKFELPFKEIIWWTKS
jgi:hypothetical protein